MQHSTFLSYKAHVRTWHLTYIACHFFVASDLRGVASWTLFRYITFAGALFSTNIAATRNPEAINKCPPLPHLCKQTRTSVGGAANRLGNREMKLNQ